MKLSIMKAFVEAVFWKGASAAVESVKLTNEERIPFMQAELDKFLAEMEAASDKIEIVEDL